MGCGTLAVSADNSGTEARADGGSFSTGQNREFTLPEANIAPARKLSQKETSLPTIHFQVRVFSFREGIAGWFKL